MNITMTVKFQPRGVVTMPKKIRTHFGWEDGDIADVVVVDEGVLFKPSSHLSPDLQEMIKAAHEDKKNGDYIEFSTISEFHKKRKDKWSRK